MMMMMINYHSVSLHQVYYVPSAYLNLNRASSVFVCAVIVLI